MRTITALTLVILAGVVSAAPKDSQPGLHVHGKTVLVVTALPFEIHCGDKADFYFWKLPTGWTVKSSFVSDTVEVTSAPEGSATVELTTFRSDFDAKKNIIKEYKLLVNVGKVAPPPDPDSPLVKSLRAAYASEADTNKTAQLGLLSALYRQAPAIVDDATLKTWGDLSGRIRSASDNLGVSGKLPGVQKVIGNHLVMGGFPTKSGTLLDPSGRSLARRLLAEVGSALTEVGK